MFQQIRMETDQVKMIFATTLGEMYPVRLCLHILPDVLWHVVAGSWSDLHAYAWERSVFFRMFPDVLDFAAKNWEIGRQPNREQRDERCNE